jgi:hypothetical protein
VHGDRGFAAAALVISHDHDVGRYVRAVPWHDRHARPLAGIEPLRVVAEEASAPEALARRYSRQFG